MGVSPKAKQQMFLLDRVSRCEQSASHAAHQALQRIAAGELDEAKADLRRALADVERGLLWKHQMDRLTH